MPNKVSFRYFKTSPEIIQRAFMLYLRCPLSHRKVEGLLHERSPYGSYEFAQYWSCRVFLQENLGQAGQRLPITFLQRDAMAWY
jgi:hypothetical protein